MEGDDGEMEDVSASYVRDCLDEWGQLIQFLEDWEVKLFTMSLSDYQSLPHVTQVCRRIHARWLNEQRKSTSHKK